MNARVSVAELIKAFGATYRAIDIRTAAVREGDRWVNAVTIARPTYEEPEDVEARLHKIEERYGPARTNRFCIRLESRSFSGWDEFCAEANAGILHIAGLEVAFRQPLTLGDDVGYLHPIGQDIRPFEGHPWPALHVYHNQRNSSRFTDETLVREISAHAYSHPYELINLLCEANVAEGQSHGHELYLSDRPPVAASLG